MAHQLIYTSAKQGLDGIPGYRTVLRSAGMPPQVATRLKAAAAYSHPFPAGDDRNPMVYLHQHEKAADKIWHVLGCIRDVPEHTGRSNFLAHMLAADQAEVRGKKGGPAAVMATAGLFVQSWQGPPDGAAQTKLLVAGDKAPVKGSCPAWTTAGLDPGLAGDLAMHAAAGKPVVIVTRPDDKVLALFCDALLLVPPEKRWSVTFNTCAIEGFNGIWTAIRADLPQARGLRDSRAAVVIDLTTNPRGSEDGYARFARGDAETLPWQAAVPKPEGPEPPIGPPVGPRVRPPRPPRKPSVVPRPTAGPGGIDPGGDPGAPPGRWEEKSPGRSWRRPLLSVAAGVLFMTLLVAYVYREEIGGLVSPAPVPPKMDQVVHVPVQPAGPTPEELTRQKEQQRKAALAEARKKLDSAGGRPREAIRSDAAALIATIRDLRRGTKDEPPLAIKLPGGADPTDTADRAKNAADQADELLQRIDEPPSFLADLEAATRELAEAVGLLDATRKQVPEIAAAERKARSDAMSQQQAAEAAKRRRDAFAAFKAPVPPTALPIDNQADTLGGTQVSKPTIDLIAFSAADLVEPELRLAVPVETINGQPFEPVIKDLGSGRWEVQYSTGFLSPYDNRPEPPQTIASITARDGMLVLEVDRNQLGRPQVSLLRRCVILVEAKDPETKQPSVREVRLVQPVKVGPLKLDPAAGKQAITIPPPPGIFRRDAPPGSPETNLALPVSGIEVKVQCGRETIFVRLPEQATDTAQPGIVIWPDVHLADLEPGVELMMTVTLSLPGATFACTPKLVGPAAKNFDLSRMAAFNKLPPSTLADLQKKFEQRSNKCPGREFKRARGNQSDITNVTAWFGMPLATVAIMKLDMPGHATITDSMNLYFQAEYARRAQELKTEWETQVAATQDDKKKKELQDKGPNRPDFPKDFADWEKRCGAAKELEWDRVFGKHLDAWAKWFWQKFETHWKTQQQRAEAALDQVTEVRLLAITSVARDAEGNEYRVPLVEFHPDAPAEPASFTGSPEASPTARDEPGPALSPDAGEPIGID